MSGQGTTSWSWPACIAASIWALFSACSACMNRVLTLDAKDQWSLLVGKAGTSTSGHNNHLQQREVESIISCTNPKQQGFCRGNTAEYKESRIRFMESLLAKVHPHSREQLWFCLTKSLCATRMIFSHQSYHHPGVETFATHVDTERNTHPEKFWQLLASKVQKLSDCRYMKHAIETFRL